MSDRPPNHRINLSQTEFVRAASAEAPRAVKRALQRWSADVMRSAAANGVSTSGAGRRPSCRACHLVR
jgi:hypothetical protein